MIRNGLGRQTFAIAIKYVSVHTNVPFVDCLDFFIMLLRNVLNQLACPMPQRCRSSVIVTAKTVVPVSWTWGLRVCISTDSWSFRVSLFPWPEGSKCVFWIANTSVLTACPWLLPCKNWVVWALLASPHVLHMTSCKHVHCISVPHNLCNIEQDSSSKAKNPPWVYRMLWWCHSTELHANNCLTYCL